MCIDFDGHHSNGISFVYVNDFCYYRNCLYTHRYKFSSENKKSKESQYMVSHLEIGSDPQIGSDRESRHDSTIHDASNSGPLFAFNDGEAEIALTSRRCSLLTSIFVDPTSRRWDITIFQPALCTSTLCSKMLPKTPIPHAVHTQYKNQMSGL